MLLLRQRLPDEPLRLVRELVPLSGLPVASALPALHRPHHSHGRGTPQPEANSCHRSRVTPACPVAVACVTGMDLPPAGAYCGEWPVRPPGCPRWLWSGAMRRRRRPPASPGLEVVMTTDTHVSMPSGAASARALDGEARVRLYETMVLSRTYEEAILREYHADKGPGFDIGKGLVPEEVHLSAGQEPVAASVCAPPDHRGRGHRHPPTAPLRHRPRHGPAEDDGRDLRPRDRARPGPRRSCTCSTPAPTSRVRASSRRAARPPSGRRSPSNERARIASSWPSPARGPPTRAPSTSRSTSRRPGTCRSSSSWRTTTGASPCRSRPARDPVQRRPGRGLRHPG